MLLSVDKARYRKHLNIIIVTFIASLAIFALLFGQLLIFFFADGVSSNFKFNLAGVIASLLLQGMILSYLKDSTFFYEVYQVWQVKQTINLIYRKLSKIKTAAKNNDKNALIVLSYYYQACYEVYLLDDNSITIESVEANMNNAKQQLAELYPECSVNDFDKSLLTNF